MERWKINLYTVWISQVLSIMSFSFGMPFIPFYIQDLGVVDPDKIKLYTGILSMAPAVTMAVMAPIWGMAADRWGKKLMLLRAMLGAALIIAAMGIVSNANQLVVLRLLQGVFTGTVTAAMALVASGTPSNRLTSAIGFMTSSTFIGTSIGPVIGGFLAEMTGYRFSFYLGGALMLIDFILVLLFVKEEKMEGPLEKAAVKPHNSLLSIFTPITAVMFFLIFILIIARSLFNPYLPLFVQEIHSANGGVAKLTGIINGITGLSTALAGLTISRLGDRFDKAALLKVMFTGGIVSAILLPLISNSLWFFAAAYGIFFFVIGGMEPVAISISAENTSADRRGVLFGIQGTIRNIGFAIAPVLGSLISLKYSLQAILVVMPIMLVPGLVSVLLFGKNFKRTAVIPESSDVKL